MFKKAWLLFINTFMVSMTANSGYAIISVFRNRFVDKYHWFTKEEMEDYIALAQSCPGPLAVSSSMILGYQSAGLFGAFAAVLGVIIPPIVIMILVTCFYTWISSNQIMRIFITGMEAGVCAMLMDVVIGMFKGVMKMNDLFYYAMVILSFLFVRLTDLSIFYLTLICIMIAVLRYLFILRKVKDSL